MRVCMCVCVCVCERERETHTHAYLPELLRGPVRDDVELAKRWAVCIQRLVACGGSSGNGGEKESEGERVSMSERRRELPQKNIYFLCLLHHHSPSSKPWQ